VGAIKRHIAAEAKRLVVPLGSADGAATRGWSTLRRSRRLFPENPAAAPQEPGSLASRHMICPDNWRAVRDYRPSALSLGTLSAASCSRRSRGRISGIAGRWFGSVPWNVSADSKPPRSSGPRSRARVASSNASAVDDPGSKVISAAGSVRVPRRQSSQG
jgi:hypothetical protein